MLTGGVMLFIASLLFGETWTSPVEWTQSVQLSMVLLIIFGSIVAFTAFNFLLRVVSPEKVATSTYVNPIIALFMGWYLLNEQVTQQSIIAAIILLTGVYFINTKKKLTLYSRFKK
jgi:drug/metabolite transporter (DMT)-like permease